VSISTSNTVQTFRKTKTAPQVHSDYPDLYASDLQTATEAGTSPLNATES